MTQQITARKQQGTYLIAHWNYLLADTLSELQNQYTNYKNGLQQIASKIGDVETEAEEHKWVPGLFYFTPVLQRFIILRVRGITYTRHTWRFKFSPLESLMLTVLIQTDLFSKHLNLFLVTGSVFEW